MIDEEVNAARDADWQQVILNGGPPCFHLEGGRFCLRAERWEGHGSVHPYRPLDELLYSVAATANAEARVEVLTEWLRRGEERLAAMIEMQDELERLRDGRILEEPQP